MNTPTTKTLTKPTIHTNGTGAQSLLDGYCEVGSKIRAAMKALEDAGPHGRDYYPQGDDAIRTATAEHVSRLERLESVLAEIQALAQHVADTKKR